MLYEDDLIRVISVRLAPGATDKLHHHRFPAVFVIDRMVKLRDFNGVTNEEISLPIPKDVVFPITVKFAPQPLHYVENLDTKPFHATRIEFKHASRYRAIAPERPCKRPILAFGSISPRRRWVSNERNKRLRSSLFCPMQSSPL